MQLTGNEKETENAIHEEKRGETVYIMCYRMYIINPNGSEKGHK